MDEQQLMDAVRSVRFEINAFKELSEKTSLRRDPALYRAPC